ncbi:MAG: MFS transporter [Nocardioides sp.]|uniref:MFS transporter n=1 Tax=Nocardioides sp. TaxID=35761 RepID=UPI0039E3BAEE
MTHTTRMTGRAGDSGVLFAMCLSLVLVVASVSALNLALPDLATSLDADNSDLTWIADGYTVALAALVLPIGAIGDRIGRRNVLIVGNIVFGAAALAAASATSPDTLIAWRVMMGLGAAMIMPGTLSTITATFPADKQARGVAIWSGFAAAGAIIGMLGAGALLEYWGWESIFHASAGVAAVAAVAALALAPNTRDSHHPRFDILGALFTATGVGTLVFAIIEGNEKGWIEPTTLVSGAVAATAFAAYALAGLRNDQPLLDPRLFGLPGFRAGAITIVVQFLALFGFFFVGLQYLQLILDYSPLTSAVALVPVGLIVLPVAALTPRAVTRIGLKLTMSVGLLLIAAGLYWVSFVTTESGYLLFLGGLLVAGVGFGLTSSTGTSAIVGSLSTRKQGVASAMNDASREVGAALGIAIMGSIFSNQYSSALPDLSALPTSAADAVKDSAAGGLAAAEQLGTAGNNLAAAVEQAFVDGLSSSLVVVSAILVVAALGSLVRAPKRAPLTADADQAEANQAEINREAADRDATED